MGELLPDGTIGGYEGYCPICGLVIKKNIQGNEIGNHLCKPYKIAVLCAHKKSNYYQIPGLEVYDKDRNCRTFRGGMPIIAHPSSSIISETKPLSFQAIISESIPFPQQSHVAVHILISCIIMLMGSLARNSLSIFNSLLNKKQ